MFLRIQKMLFEEKKIISPYVLHRLLFRSCLEKRKGINGDLKAFLSIRNLRQEISTSLKKILKHILTIWFPE